MKANEVNVFKILTFGTIRKKRNLTIGQLGIVKNLRGDELQAYKFWKT